MFLGVRGVIVVNIVLVVLNVLVVTNVTGVYDVLGVFSPLQTSPTSYPVGLGSRFTLSLYRCRS